MQRAAKLLPGIILVFLLALVSRVLAGLISPVFNLESLTVGILLGIILAATVKIPNFLRPGLDWSQKSLLALGVILLGFRLNFPAMAAAGPRVLILVLIFVPSVIVLGVGVGKLLGANIRLAILIGVGTAICGSSAVAALAPTIGAEEEEIVVAVSIISVLGAIGVLIYSGVAVVYQGSDAGFGVWSGLTLHNVAHALAAAFVRGEAAGEIGTVVKLTRVVMLAFVAPALGLVFRDQKTGRKSGIPGYVVYFLAAAVMGNLLPFPVSILSVISTISSTLITMAMIAMGLAVSFGTLRAKGGRALMTGALLFFLSSLTGLLLVSRLF
jgi:uncharacterized integral membrane protein (TIGR00698 family)